MANAGDPNDQPLFLSTQSNPARWEEIFAPSNRAGTRALAIADAADRNYLLWLRSGARQFWVWLVITFLVAIIYGIVNRYVVTSVIVQGRSMVPTLQDGERYLLDRWSYHYRTPQRGDVVVLHDPGHTDLAIKRIVGVPGDTLHLKDGMVLLNGTRFIEPYLASGTRTFTPTREDRMIMLGEGQFFVLGDNRFLSEDSRFYGPVHRQRIVGCITQ